MERLHLIIPLIYKLPEQVKHLLALTAIRYMIYAAINIFLPAYIIYHYNLQLSILYLTLQYFVFYTLISTEAFKRVVKKYSAEEIQLVSMIIGITGIVTVFLIEGISGIAISAFLINLSTVFYQLSKHYVIVKYASQRDKMEESVMIENIGRIVYFITPFISSYIIYKLGYSIYYAITTFAVLSVIGYFAGKIKKKETYLTPDIKGVFSHNLLFFLEGVIISGWILTTTAFLFYNIHSNVRFYGVLKSISQLLVIVLSYYIAKSIDKKHNLKISTISLTILGVLFYFYYIFKGNILMLSILVTLISLFYHLGSLSPIAFLYEYAKSIDMGIIIGREIMLALGKTSVLLASIYFRDIVIIVSILTLIYVFLFYRTAILHKHII